MNNKWVQIWGQSHSSLSHFYYPSAEKTFRFVINSALDGNAIRIELSNECADNDVYIGAVSCALCDENGVLAATPENVTVKGKCDFILKKGETLFTDELPLKISASEYIAISIFVKKGDLRSGNLLDNVKLITAAGDVTGKKDVINERRKRDTVIEVAGKILNLFLHKPLPIIQSVQLLNDTDASSIVIFGDSLCQQGFWTNRFEKRVREEYNGQYSVINKSIMGNRVLHDFSPRFPCKGLFGYHALKRIEKDILAYSDVEYVIFALGTNDFLQPGTIAAPADERVTPEEVLECVIGISDMLRDRGIRMIVVNVPMFGECIDSRREKEEVARKYNELLEKNKDKFFMVYDQMSVVLNNDKPNCSDIKYLGKDKLHYNTAGGEAIAGGFDLSVFSE